MTAAPAHSQWFGETEGSSQWWCLPNSPPHTAHYNLISWQTTCSPVSITKTSWFDRWLTSWHRSLWIRVRARSCNCLYTNTRPQQACVLFLLFFCSVHKQREEFVHKLPCHQICRWHGPSFPTSELRLKIIAKCWLSSSSDATTHVWITVLQNQGNAGGFHKITSCAVCHIHPYLQWRNIVNSISGTIWAEFVVKN